MGLFKEEYPARCFRAILWIEGQAEGNGDFCPGMLCYVTVLTFLGDVHCHMGSFVPLALEWVLSFSCHLTDEGPLAQKNLVTCQGHTIS